MLVFYINFFTMFLYGFLYLLKPIKKVKLIITILISAQLILLLGMRKYDINGDTFNYYYYSFRYLEMGDFSSFWGKTFSISGNYIYKVFNLIVWRLGGNYQAFLFVMALLEIIPFSIFIYKHSQNFVMSFVVLLSFNFYFYSFITIRQIIAYGIMLLNIENVFNKKPIRFIAIVLLVSQIHISALFFLPAYLLIYFKPNFTTLSIFGLIGIFFIVFGKALLTLVINLFFTKYEIIESPSVVFLLFNLFIFLLCFVIYKKTNDVDASQTKDEFQTKNNYFLMLYLTGILLMTFCTITNNALRIAQFYSVSVILVLPNCLSKMDKQTKIITYPFVYIGLFFVFLRIMSSVSTGMPAYIPFWAN